MNTLSRTLDLAAEDLEDLDAPDFDVTHFALGVASGIALVAVGVAVVT